MNLLIYELSLIFKEHVSVSLKNFKSINLIWFYKILSKAHYKILTFKIKIV